MKKFKCRACQSRGKIVLNLGKQPLANAIKVNKKKENKYDLILLQCNKCHTLQLSKDIHPKILFSNYVWVTGTSDSTIRYLKDFSAYIFKKMKYNPNLRILEIASNDGSFLKILKKKFNYVIGIEPAKNLAKLSNKNNLKTYNYFFNNNSSKLILKKIKNKVDLIICRNVIPHINNLHSVFKGINNILDKKGKLIIEFHYAEHLLKDLHFDYIYHEHVYYFTIKTLSNYLKYYDLYPNDVKLSKISGGSLILTFSYDKKRTIKLDNYIIKEKKLKLHSKITLNKFKFKITKYKKKIKEIINKNSYKIAGYGSSARSNTLINFLNLNDNKIKYIFDKNSLKHGKYTPGSNLKIIKPSSTSLKKFNTIIVFAWNFYDEIKEELKKLKFKGKIIKVLPKPKIEKI